jgi:hypothetical protein
MKVLPLVVIEIRIFELLRSFIRSFQYWSYGEIGTIEVSSPTFSTIFFVSS